MNKQFTFEDLPKYLIYGKGDKEKLFRPTVFKWEWEGHSNAYFAMYAQYNPGSKTLRVNRALIWAIGSSYDEALERFLAKCKENRKFMSGKTWKGDKPFDIDLMNPNR